MVSVGDGISVGGIGVGVTDFTVVAVGDGVWVSVTVSVCVAVCVDTAATASVVAGTVAAADVAVCPPDESTIARIPITATKIIAPSASKPVRLPPRTGGMVVSVASGVGRGAVASTSSRRSGITSTPGGVWPVKAILKAAARSPAD